MDANETMEPKERNTAAGNSRSGVSALEAYKSTMRDAHEHANPTLYPGGGEWIGSYTHQQPSHNEGKQGKMSKAKLDRVMVSNSIAKRKTITCTLDDGPREWGGRTYRKYHKAIKTEIQWEGIWKPKEHQNIKGLEGEELELGPNMAKMTPEKESQLAKNIDEVLAKNWKRISSIWKNRWQTAESRASDLRNELTKIVNKQAIKVLGRRKKKK